MTDTKFPVRQAIEDLTDGTSSSGSFQERIDEIQKEQQGANWFTICSSANAVLGDYGYSEDDRDTVIMELLEAFEREQVEQTFGRPAVESAIGEDN